VTLMGHLMEHMKHMLYTSFRILSSLCNLICLLLVGFLKETCPVDLSLWPSRHNKSISYLSRIKF